MRDRAQQESAARGRRMRGSMSDVEGRRRVAIEAVAPEIDAGAFPIKRCVGEAVTVEADVFADGHDLIRCRVLYRVNREDEPWSHVFMEPLGNDRWRAAFPVSALAPYQYTVEGWVDPFLTWQSDLAKRVDAGQDVRVDLKIGADWVAAAAGRASGSDKNQLERWAEDLRSGKKAERRIELALSEELTEVVHRHPDLSQASRYPRVLDIVVDSARARTGAWYELFPRAAGALTGAHGTFKDCETLLPTLAEMGFDVLYFPPIHPIGETFRKGPNNTPNAGPHDPGSPWGIGSKEGGHKAVHPDLGTLDDFRHLVAAARQHQIDIALDIAFQCSPDHPYVREHPEWFRHRPDGSIQYAENPPKKYQDIYPFDFECEDWQALWQELKSIVEFWIDQGVSLFRVDNPHTKPFAFWEWLIGEIRSQHPEAVFLAEAFTRPKVMYRLAKVGFNQSYTYFAWRNAAWELRQYFTELTQSEVAEYFRPNLWPNTPDILTAYLQSGGRPAFLARLVLAATLGASYGIYGPAFELREHQSAAPGSEEYLNSEKYEIRDWDRQTARPMMDFIALVNQIRRAHPALHANRRLVFHDVDNPQLLCYSKTTEGMADSLLMVVNVDPHHVQSGWLNLDLEALGLGLDDTYQVHELLTDARYYWRGSGNFVQLDPNIVPAHILHVRRRMRDEQDFEYYA